MPAAPPRATSFLTGAALWGAGIFALLGHEWVKDHVLGPLTRMQQQAADHYFGRPSTAVVVTADCSGADVVAVCLVAMLAYPAPWRVRLAGSAGGAALLLALNTVRIATLGHAANDPELFPVLHLQVWPLVLFLAALGYVVLWMRGLSAPDDPRFARPRAFAAAAATFLVAFVLCAPTLAQSATLVEAGAALARLAAAVLTAGGAPAVASANLLATSRGAFLVTPECIATPLIPVYVAGVLAARLSWSWRLLALAATPVLFGLLALGRLLVLALPGAVVASPLVLVHGFHQLVAAVVAVMLLALWRTPPGPGAYAQAARRAAAALSLAVLAMVLGGEALTRLVVQTTQGLASLAPHARSALAGPGDTQGALAVLPAYQAGLLLALGIVATPGWRRLAGALLLLFGSQVLLLVALGELAVHAGLPVHALLLRGCALAVPAALAIGLLRAVPLPIHSARPAGDGPG